MTYRLVGSAADAIDRILLDSTERWGIETAGNYLKLMLRVFDTLARSPNVPGSSAIQRLDGIRAYPLRLGRNLVPPDHRIGSPRHIVVYRIATDGRLEVLGLAHDRMLLGRAARRMQRDVPE